MSPTAHMTHFVRLGFNSTTSPPSFKSNASSSSCSNGFGILILAVADASALCSMSARRLASFSIVGLEDEREVLEEEEKEEGGEAGDRAEEDFVSRDERSIRRDVIVIL